MVPEDGADRQELRTGFHVPQWRRRIDRENHVRVGHIGPGRRSGIDGELEAHSLMKKRADPYSAARPGCVEREFLAHTVVDAACAAEAFDLGEPAAADVGRRLRRRFPGRQVEEQQDERCETMGSRTHGHHFTRGFCGKWRPRYNRVSARLRNT